MLHEKLAQTIDLRTTGNEDILTPIPNLSLFRREAPMSPTTCLIEPSIVLVAQGVKQLWVGEEVYRYDPDRFLITSFSHPANSEVVTASATKPCLGLVMKLDRQILTELITQGSLSPPVARSDQCGVGIGTVTPQIIEPFVRLLDLLDEHDAIPMLAPLIQREIHFRLLLCDQAARLWQTVSIGSQTQRVAKAVDWLTVNYASQFRIEELAAYVQMSTSGFYHHFRKLTSMSPLQYQKWLRLNEAKRLMLNESLDVMSAAFRVGYESPTQFSREYSRFFGIAPKRDIANLRNKVKMQEACSP